MLTRRTVSLSSSACRIAAPRRVAKFRVLRLAIAGICVAGLSVSAIAASGASGYGGIYVRVDVSQAQNADDYQAALNQPFVDGAAIVVPWKALEPAPGQYDFSALDRWVKAAVTRNKKISFGIMAGALTPGWVYAKPNPAANVTMPNAKGPAGNMRCGTATVPVPWDANFIAKFGDAVKATATHLRNLKVDGKPPGAAFAAVKIARLTGINVASAELALPIGYGRSRICLKDDPTRIWLNAGLSQDKLTSAWTQLSGTIAAAYPDAKLSLSIIRNRAFPMTADNSPKAASALPDADAYTSAIISTALAKYPGRIAVQWNALSAQAVNPAVVAAGRKGAIIGWQLNQSGGASGTFCFYGQRGPNMVRQKCNSAADYATILNNGVANGGKYLEIWAPNASEYAASLQAVHDKMQ